MELHCGRSFAARGKLATSEAARWESAGPWGMDRHRNDKGALRMIFGMRVRGGLLAALIMFAVPVAATLAAMFVVFAGRGADRGFDQRRGQPARRGRDHPLLFQARSRRTPRSGPDRRRPEGADRNRPVPGRANQPARRPDRGRRGRKPRDRADRLRGQQEDQGRAAYGGNPVQAARHVLAPDGAVRRPAHRRNLPALRPLRRPASIRRSSSSRTTASISSSPSPKGRKPASNRSSSSATTTIRRIACATSSRRTNPIC